MPTHPYVAIALQIMELLTSKSGPDSQLVDSIKMGINKLTMDHHIGSSRHKEELSVSESNKRQKV